MRCCIGCELDASAHQRLIEHSRRIGILFLSSPFDTQSVDLLATMDVPLFKVPSGEITNLPFLQHVARKGRPVILSTGMSTLGEVEEAVHVLQAAGASQLTLLHCVTEYPAPYAEVNLRAMQTLKSAFGLPVGYSDHTPGIDIAIAAVALGAEVIEKHFTLDRSSRVRIMLHLLNRANFSRWWRRFATSKWRSARALKLPLLVNCPTFRLPARVWLPPVHCPWDTGLPLETWTSSGPVLASPRSPARIDWTHSPCGRRQRRHHQLGTPGVKRRKICAVQPAVLTSGSSRTAKSHSGRSASQLQVIASGMHLAARFGQPGGRSKPRASN